MILPSTVTLQPLRSSRLEVTKEACGTMLAPAPRRPPDGCRSKVPLEPLPIGARGPLRAGPCSLRSSRLPTCASAGLAMAPQPCPPTWGSYLPLQCGGRERRVTLHHRQEQGDPPRGAEGGAHARRDRDAAHEAQRAPAPVLLAAHLPLRGRCGRENSSAHGSRRGAVSLDLPFPGHVCRHKRHRQSSTAHRRKARSQKRLSRWLTGRLRHFTPRNTRGGSRSPRNGVTDCA